MRMNNVPAYVWKISGKPPSVIRPLMVMMLLVVAVFCTGCKSKSKNSSENKVVDSEVYSAESSNEKTVWLDNDRVVFVATQSFAPAPGPRFLAIWNTATGKIELSHQITGLICGREGQVFFATKDDETGKRTHFRGPIENPQGHPIPGPGMYLNDTYACDWLPQATSGNRPLTYPYIKKLRDDNYLEVLEPLTQISEGRALYYEKPGAEGKEIPLSYQIDFNEFLNAYVLNKATYDPANPGTNSFRILERDGNFKDVLISKAMLHGRQKIYPLKYGYLSDYSDGKYSNTDPGDRGLWWLQGEKVERMIVGALHGVSISPDGCKTAFIHARNSKDYFSQKQPYRTIKFIDLCTGGAKP